MSSKLKKSESKSAKNKDTKPQAQVPSSPSSLIQQRMTQTRSMTIHQPIPIGKSYKAQDFYKYMQKRDAKMQRIIEKEVRDQFLDQVREDAVRWAAVDKKDARHMKRQNEKVAEKEQYDKIKQEKQEIIKQDQENMEKWSKNRQPKAKESKANQENLEETYDKQEQKETANDYLQNAQDNTDVEMSQSNVQL
eukprot:403342939